MKHEIEAHEQAYVARHSHQVLCGIRVQDAFDVRNHERLQLAAWLEYMVGRKVYHLSEARREFVIKYPEHNVIVSGKTLVDIAGRKKFSPNPTSVLELIQPYADSILRIKNLNEVEADKETLTLNHS